MGSRVYDPLLGRFLSPDPFIQAPKYPNNYNRYTYALNNPLKYIDPSGYETYLSPGYMAYSNHAAEPSITPGRWDQPSWLQTIGGGGALSHLDPFGGWSYNKHTGHFHSKYGGDPMTGEEFFSSTPYFRSLRYSRPATVHEVEGAIGTVTGTTASFLPGVDPIGNRYMILESASGALRAEAIPFWKITGSYYNHEYFLSGVEAYGDLNFFKRLVRDNFEKLNYLPIAHSKELNISGEVGVAGSVTPFGAIIMGGAEGLKIKTFGSVAGTGLGMIGANAQISNMYYFYSGNRSAFTSDVFSGSSVDFEFSFGNGLVGSVNVSFMLDRANPGEFLIGFGHSAGFGLSPTFWSVSGTWQYTDYYGR